MAENPYVNKVEVNGNTIIDLTADTVDAAHLAQGYTAHDLSGAPIVGTMIPGGGGGGIDLSSYQRVDIQQLNQFDTVSIEGEFVRAVYIGLGAYGITSANQIKLVEISEIGPVSSTSQSIYIAQNIITLNPPYRLTRRESIRVTELTTPPTFTTGKQGTILSTTNSGCNFNEASLILFSRTLNDLISKCHMTIYYEAA